MSKIIQEVISQAKSAQKLVSLVRNENQFYIVMDQDDNRINPDFIYQYNEALQEIDDLPLEEKQQSSIVSISTHEKIFSNGLDLGKFETPQDIALTLYDFSHLCARLLAQPIPSVALVNGHAFAGGFFLALAHDYRIMRKETGFMCLNEVEMGVQIPQALNEMGVAKLGRPGYWEAAVMAKRFSGTDAQRIRLVDRVFEEEQILNLSRIYANQKANQGSNLDAMKRMKESIY